MFSDYEIILKTPEKKERAINAFCIENTIIQSRHMDTGKIMDEIPLRQGKNDTKFKPVNYYMIYSIKVTHYELKYFMIVCCACELTVGFPPSFHYKLSADGKIIPIFNDWDNHAMGNYVFQQYGLEVIKTNDRQHLLLTSLVKKGKIVDKIKLISKDNNIFILNHNQLLYLPDQLRRNDDGELLGDEGGKALIYTLRRPHGKLDYQFCLPTDATYIFDDSFIRSNWRGRTMQVFKWKHDQIVMITNYYSNDHPVRQLHVLKLSLCDLIWKNIKTIPLNDVPYVYRSTDNRIIVNYCTNPGFQWKAFELSNDLELIEITKSSIIKEEAEVDPTVDYQYLYIPANSHEKDQRNKILFSQWTRFLPRDLFPIFDSYLQMSIESRLKSRQGFEL